MAAVEGEQVGRQNRPSCRRPDTGYEGSRRPGTWHRVGPSARQAVVDRGVEPQPKATSRRWPRREQPGSPSGSAAPRRERQTAEGEQKSGRARPAQRIAPAASR